MLYTKRDFNKLINYIVSVLRFTFTHFNSLSLNPAVYIGQLEGGFIFGMGYYTSEEIKYDLAAGRLLASDTWYQLISANVF